jgi:hypothetical protein
VPIDLRFIGIDVVGIDHIPSLTLQGKAYQPDAGEELGGSWSTVVVTAVCKREPIAALR